MTEQLDVDGAVENHGNFQLSTDENVKDNLDMNSHDNLSGKLPTINESELSGELENQLKHLLNRHTGKRDDQTPSFIQMDYDRCVDVGEYEQPLKAELETELLHFFAEGYQHAVQEQADDAELLDHSIVESASLAFANRAVQRLKDDTKGQSFSAASRKYLNRRRIETVDYPVVYIVYGNEETGAYDVTLKYDTVDGRKIWFNPDSEDANAVRRYVASSDSDSSDIEDSLESRDDSTITEDSQDKDSRSMPKGVDGDRYKWKRGYTVYVGETNDIARRVREHLNSDPSGRSDWAEVAKRLTEKPGSYKQVLICDQFFTKSMTEDIEDRLIDYMVGVPDVKKLMNRRRNPQSNYHQSEMTTQIFHDIWRGLGNFWSEKHPDSPELFPDEQVIFDSALFKASPFHNLTDEQRKAARLIMDVVEDKLRAFSQSEKSGGAPAHSLILVAGAAGTGKTVLLSHLFYRLNEELGDMRGARDKSEVDLIVNHDQQLTVYRNIAKKLGMDKVNTSSITGRKTVAEVTKAIGFINAKSSKVEIEEGKEYQTKAKVTLYDYDKPAEIADVALVDEAHLLQTRSSQSYQGGNQLYDIIMRSKVTVAVFDPSQIIQERCDWSPDLIARLFPEGWRDLASAEFAVADPLRQNAADAANSRSRSVDLPIIQMKTPDIDYWSRKKRNMGVPPLPEKVDRKPLTVDVTNIVLKAQMRVCADDATINWIDDFIAEHQDDNRTSACGVIGHIPADPGEMREPQEENYRNIDGSYSAPKMSTIEWVRQPYEIKVFESPVELFQAIYAKARPNNLSRHEGGLSRVIATYDWPYTSGKVNENDPCGFWNVEMYCDENGDWQPGLSEDMKQEIDSTVHTCAQSMGSALVETFGIGAKNVDVPDDGVIASMPDDRFCMPWNMEFTKYSGSLGNNTSGKTQSGTDTSHKKRGIYQQTPKSVTESLASLSDRWSSTKHRVAEERSWAEEEHTVFEVGSTYTIQGFDLNIAGVIIGPSVKYRDGKVIYDPDASCDQYAKEKKASQEDRIRNIRNQFNVLMKRGVHGLYIFAVDKQLREKLLEEYQGYLQERKEQDANNLVQWKRMVKIYEAEHSAASDDDESTENELQTLS
ncbi:MAG: DUF2075 domain-containing protein [Bifidobacterium thermophilum]|nr:DUF2075 domain-containing protein [Bifidobacterium thermophilum]